MRADTTRKPWYRRKVDRTHNLIFAALWVPGWILAMFTTPIPLRLAGLALIWIGVAVEVHGLVRARD